MGHRHQATTGTTSPEREAWAARRTGVPVTQVAFPAGFPPEARRFSRGSGKIPGFRSFVVFGTLRNLAVTSSHLGVTVRCEDCCGHFPAHTSNTCCKTSPADPRSMCKLLSGSFFPCRLRLLSPPCVFVTGGVWRVAGRPRVTGAV